MKADQFKDVLDAQIKRVQDVLVVKTEEYAAEEDQLHNIRMAALLKEESLPEAVIGMMVKHTVSIFSMVKSGKPFPEDKWDEKLTDHIVWLVLLKAALTEGAQRPLDVASDDPQSFITNFLRMAADDPSTQRSSIDVGDSRTTDMHKLPASDVLRYAASILEATTPNPNQGTLPC